MITKEEIEMAAIFQGCATDAGQIGFHLGASWALAQLDPICNDAANLIEQFKRDFTVIPGTKIAIYWATVSPEFKFATVSYYGRISFHTQRPYNNSHFQWVCSGSNLEAGAVKPYDGFENWQELIFERPE